MAIASPGCPFAAARTCPSHRAPPARAPGWAPPAVNLPAAPGAEAGIDRGGIAHRRGAPRRRGRRRRCDRDRRRACWQADLLRAEAQLLRQRRGHGGGHQQRLRRGERVVGLDLGRRGDPIVLRLGRDRRPRRRRGAAAWPPGDRRERPRPARAASGNTARTSQPWGAVAASRGWMDAMSSASATTTSPSTFASPRSFQIAPPLRSGTTSSVSTSPGHDRLAELRLVDGHEVDDLRLGIERRPGCAASSAPACASASMISTPGITGCPGKWPLKCGSLRDDQLARDDLLLADLVDAIDEQERIAVRKDPLDGADVEHGAPTSWAAAGAAWRGRRRAVGALAAVVAADELVGQVEVRLGEAPAPTCRRSS